MNYRQNNITATYQNNEWLIRQYLSSIGLYDFPDDFDKIISFFEKHKSYYQKYLQEISISEICGQKFSIKESWKVKFDHIELDLQLDEYDGNVFKIIGLRKPIKEELEFLEKYRQNQENKILEQRKKQFEDLKKEFES